LDASKIGSRNPHLACLIPVSARHRSILAEMQPYLPMLAIILLCATAACADSTPPSPTTAATPSLVHATPSPQSSPSLTRTPYVTPTATATFAGLFPPQTPLWQWLESTATPLPTPSLPETRYRLRTWTDQDAILALQAIDKYVHDDDVDGVCGIRREFYTNQFAARILASEVLLRFPETQNWLDIRWRLALASAVTDNHSSDDWILQQLSHDLGQRGFTIQTLTEELAPRRFVPFAEAIAPNLFGDNSEAHVFGVRAEEPTGDGLIFAVRNFPSTGQTAVPVASLWGFYSVWIDDVRTADHTGDGIPEILIQKDFCNCLCVPDGGYILQWESDEFIDLADGQLQGYWAFGPPDESGRETLTDTILTTTDESYGASYRWLNGHYVLEAAEDRYMTPTRTPGPERRASLLAASALDDFLAGGSPEVAIDSFSRYLGELPPYEPEKAARYYYLLGLANELSGNLDEAVRQYWTAWSTYPGSPYAIIATMKLQALP
jgi:hypothetical protein